MSDEKPKFEGSITLAEGMHLFQFLHQGVEKDIEVEVTMKSGGKYKFWYASYGNITRTIRADLFRAGLSYSFPTTKEVFCCRITHISGQFQDTVLDMVKLRDKMQDFGGDLTYMMRYTLKLALGLDVDADDDNNGASGNESNFKTPPKEHVADVHDFIKKKGKDIANYVVRFGLFKNKKLSEIDRIDIQKYLVWLDTEAKKQSKPLKGDVLEFYKIAEAYISGDGIGST